MRLIRKTNHEVLQAVRSHNSLLLLVAGREAVEPKDRQAVQPRGQQAVEPKGQQVVQPRDQPAMTPS